MKYLDNPESFETIWKYPDSFEIVWNIWKHLKISRQFWIHPESFEIIWKYPESFESIWKVFKPSRKLFGRLDNPERVQTIVVTTGKLYVVSALASEQWARFIPVGKSTLGHRAVGGIPIICVVSPLQPLIQMSSQKIKSSLSVYCFLSFSLHLSSSSYSGEKTQPWSVVPMAM